jgi:hypothetical protein
MAENVRPFHLKKKSGFLPPSQAAPQKYSRGDIDGACDWLRTLLAPGPLYQRDVETIAEQCGVPPSLLKLAKRELGVRSANFNDMNPAAFWKTWFWQLPEQDRDDDDDNDAPPWEDGE